MTIGSNNRELAHAPRFVIEFVPDMNALLRDLLVKVSCVSNMEIRKPGVIRTARHRPDAGTIAESQPARSTTEKGPAFDAHVLDETKLFNIECPRNGEVVDGQNKG